MRIVPALDEVKDSHARRRLGGVDQAGWASLDMVLLAVEHTLGMSGA